MISEKPKVRTRFLEWCAQSTAHGFPKIASSNNMLIRSMWIIFSLTSLGGCAYLVGKDSSIGKDYLIQKYDPNSTLSEQDIQDSFMYANIYFENLVYTMIEESASQTIVSLISNIGGTLGLFMGISLLSLIELLEIITEVFLIYLSSESKILKFSQQ